MNPFAVESRIRELADQAATEFLSPLSEKRASPDYIAKNAEKILKDAGANLTAVISKIASEENLNPHEIARVCEESNKEVFGRLYKGSQDKTFEFGVADASRVLADLNRPYEGPGDIFLPVEHPKIAAMQKQASSKKASEETSWARTALYPSTEQAVKLQMQAEKDAGEAFGELRLEAKAAGHQAALDFSECARLIVLEKQATLSELFSMVKQARPGSAAHEKAARELLSLVAIATGTRFPEGADIVVKYATALLETSETGGGKVPSDDLRHVTQEQYEFWTKSPGQQPEAFIDKKLSSGGDPVRIINGQHKLFVTLDTLINQADKEGWNNKGLLLSQDRVRTLARNVVNWKGKSESVS